MEQRISSLDVAQRNGVKITKTTRVSKQRGISRNRLS